MLPDLAFRITAQAATAAAFAKVKTDVTGIAAGMQRISTFGKALIAGFGITGILAVGNAVRGVIKDVGNLVDEADKIGIGPKRLDELRYAAEKGGAAVETLDTALVVFNRNIAKAAAGEGGDFAKILEQNGVSLTDAAGKQRSFNDLLDDYADLIRNARNESDRLLLIQAGFGKGADDLANMLAKGKEGIDAATAAHDKLTSASDADFRKLKDIDEAWDDLARKLSYGIRGTIVLTANMPDWLQGLIASVSAFPVAGGTAAIGAAGFAWQGITGGSKPAAPAGAGFSGFRAAEDASMAAYDNAGPTTKIDLDTKGADAAEKKRKQYQGVVDALALEEKNLTASNRQQEINNALSKAGVEATSAWGQTITEAAGRLYDHEQALKANSDAAQFLGDEMLTLWDSLIPKINTGNDALDSFLNTMIQTAAQALILGQGPLAGLFGTAPKGGGGVLGGLIGGLGSLLGFADGGSGTIGGSGGTDSQLFMAKVTPGERYSFVPPGRSGSQSGLIEVHIVSDASPLLNQTIDVRSTNVAVKVVQGSDAQKARQQQLAA